MDGIFILWKGRVKEKSHQIRGRCPNFGFRSVG